MIVELSLLDIMSLQGSDSTYVRKSLDSTPYLKEIFSKKETWTTEKLRASGYHGWVYVADLLEGKAAVAASPEVLADKAIKLNWVRKGMRDEYIGILKEIPQYILIEITKTMNKELGNKK